jgi:hypothetical protein
VEQLQVVVSTVAIALIRANIAIIAALQALKRAHNLPSTSVTTVTLSVAQTAMVVVTAVAIAEAVTPRVDITAEVKVADRYNLCKCKQL